MGKQFIVIGAVAMALAVGLGAFGAHGLKSRLSTAMLDVYQTGVQYHVYHALGLITVGYLANIMSESTLLLWSGWLMLAGIVLFSGSLYVLSLSGITWLGAITPFGGAAFIASWALLALAALSK